MEVFGRTDNIIELVASGSTEETASRATSTGQVHFYIYIGRPQC